MNDLSRADLERVHAALVAAAARATRYARIHRKRREYWQAEADAVHDLAARIHADWRATFPPEHFGKARPCVMLCGLAAEPGDIYCKGCRSGVPL